MFSDLNGQDSIYRIDPSNVKASPSVNSPNDGRFNSEENARWANKKLITKPFIYGLTEEDVNKSFGSDVRWGWYGAYNNSAMLSIDGYLIRLSDQQTISYDCPNSAHGPDLDFMPAQKFIAGLVNIGTSYELSTSPSSFMFPDYDPTGKVINEQFLKLWQDALTDGTIVGFAKMTYVDTYLDELTFEGNSVKYGDVSIDCSLQDDASPSDLVNQQEPVARKYMSDTTVTRVDIYYPVYVKSVKVFKPTPEKHYEDSIRICFTDIFGIELVYSAEKCQTHTYPYTFNNYMDMDDNAPIQALGTGLCDETTYPANFYNYLALYDVSGSTVGTRKSLTSTVVGFNTGTFPDIKNSLFDVYTSAQLVSGLMPASVPPEEIPNIKDSLSYYCMKFDGNGVTDPLKLSNLCLTVGQSVVPVSFMTSNGATTPEGFITGSGINPRYPVEGYLHFIKRLYVVAHNQPGYTISQPTEEQINAVTLEQLTSWTTDSNIPTNGTDAGVSNVSICFQTFYQYYMYRYVCFMLNLSYNSLIDNVVYNSELNTMKACGAGKNILGRPGTENDDTFVNQTYTVSGYENLNNTMQPTNWSVTIPYHKDQVTDYDRLHQNVLSPTHVNYIGNYYYRPSFNLMSPTTPNYFEDPINLIRRCTVSSGSNTVYTGGPSEGTVFYTINGTSLSKVTVLATREKIAIDQWLFPFDAGNSPATQYFIDPASLIAKMDCQVLWMFNGAGIYTSFANGANYSFVKNCWNVMIPYVAELQKDSKNYLSGRSYLDGKYNGINFKFLTSLDDLTKDQLLLFMYKGSSVPTTIGYDYETFNCGVCYDDEKVKTLREAFLHVSKVYDGDKELGMILDEIKSSITNIQNIVDTQIQDLSGRVGSLETTVYTDTTGLVDRVGALETKVEHSRKLLYSGELRTIVSSDHTYYEIYGFDENDQNKICEIFPAPGTVSSIGAYSSPFDPQSAPSDLCPLIGKGIGVVNVHPGIWSIQAYVFSFDFQMLNLPYTLSSLWPYACSGSSTQRSGPVYVNLQTGVRLLDGYCFRYSRVENICIPNTVVGGLSVPDVNRALGAAQSAFVDCTKLSTITFDCHDVGTTVCENCVALYDVSMTANVKHIYPYPFVGCLNYLHINYLGTKNEFLAIEKDQHWDSLDVLDTNHIQTICCTDFYASYDSATDNYIWHSYPVE